MTTAKKKKSGNNEGEIPNIPASGWDWFEGAKEQAVEATVGSTGMKAKDLQASIARALLTPEGRILMQHLRDWCFMVKDFDPELGFYNGAAFGFWRSGQKSIVQYLEAIITKETT